jgi:hypothetical protein
VFTLADGGQLSHSDLAIRDPRRIKGRDVALRRRAATSLPESSGRNERRPRARIIPNRCAPGRGEDGTARRQRAALPLSLGKRLCENAISLSSKGGEGGESPAQRKLTDVRVTVSIAPLDAARTAQRAVPTWRWCPRFGVDLAPGRLQRLVPKPVASNEPMSDDPTEDVQEHIHHHASHSEASRWIVASAMTAAILAALAAGAGALATSHLTQSTLIRIKANDDWNYYQAKSIKSSLLDAKMYSAQLSKTEPRKADLDKKNEYAEQMPAIQASAKSLEQLSKRHLESHETFEGAATLFHVAIAVVAVAVVAKRKEFWYVAMVGGAVGILIFAKALIQAPPPLKEEQEQPTEAHSAEPRPAESGAKAQP